MSPRSIHLQATHDAGEGRLQRGKKRKAAAKGKQAKTAPGVASSLYSPIDVSQVQRKSDILKGAKLEVLSFGQGPKSRDAISKLIKELGGQVPFLTATKMSYLKRSRGSRLLKL